MLFRGCWIFPSSIAPAASEAGGYGGVAVGDEVAASDCASGGYDSLGVEGVFEGHWDAVEGADGVASG